jgi:glucose-1-phosphate thymidylyltransferase
VILAAGRGTRMQHPAPGLPLDPEQERLAAAGLKALIPFHGHPFLSYTLSALADAGFQDACLVVRPGDDPVRAHYVRHPTRRLRLGFAVQEEPRGSAHALLAAEGCAAPSGAAASGAAAHPARPVVVLNGDNHYPPLILARLREMTGYALAGFDPDALIARGNIPAERIAAFALVTSHDDGTLARIVEKPDPETRRELDGRALVSMTCWRFEPGIFAACRAIAPSPRGEYELPDAVTHATTHLGARFRVIPTAEPVLDLSRREDIPAVSELLRGREVAP